MLNAPSGDEETLGVGAGSSRLHRRVVVALATLPVLALAAGFLIGIRAVGSRDAPALSTTAAESSKRDIGMRLVGAGLGYHKSGKLDLAEAFYRAAAAVDPALATAYYDLGCVALDRQDLDGAEGWFKEALRADPKDERSQGNLNWVLGQKRLAEPAGPPSSGRTAE